MIVEIYRFDETHDQEIARYEDAVCVLVKDNKTYITLTSGLTVTVQDNTIWQVEVTRG
jgi:hypothetical protein